jgi:CheY-like chemotaxis protein
MVLLVIADAETRCTAREHLQSQGLTVFATGDAHIALSWLQRHAADIVVADCLLPGTRMAIPHVLRRRGRECPPRLIGIVSEPLTADEELRELLGYDELIGDGLSLDVLAQRVLEAPV